MMAAVLEAYPVTRTLAEQRRKLTWADCEALERAGLLEWERYELIEGELIRKMAKSSLHVIVAQYFLAWLGRVFGWEYVRGESPVLFRPAGGVVTAPEPDAIVLRRKSSSFLPDNPGPEDVLLVAEVSLSTLELDLGEKARLYAMAGIPEYWVLDLNGQRIVAHREPDRELGKYQLILGYGIDEAVAPLAAPDASIRLRDLLPPA